MENPGLFLVYLIFSYHYNWENVMKFADDQIQTGVLWFQKRPRQRKFGCNGNLSHNMASLTLYRLSLV